MARLQHFHNIAYSLSSRLNTLEVWLPRPQDTSSQNAVWVIYIHGGAWRDPLIEASSFQPALSRLLSSPQLSHIAGFASINYRLSPYPKHPTHPSTVDSDPKEGRNIQHPEHVRDIAAALVYLGKEYSVGVSREYVLVGHSCGATLAFQVLDGYLAGAGEEELQIPQERAAIAKPVAIVGLEGLYDLPRLVKNHADIPVYEEFITGAFGSDRKVWEKASPSTGAYLGKEEWLEGELVVLGHSPDDELVEDEQTEIMAEVLRGRGWEKGKKGAELVLLETRGKHDEIWSEGTELSRAIEVTVGNLFS